MNKAKILGMVRHALTFGGGLVVGKGWIDKAMMVEIVGALVTLIGIAWSYYAPEKQLQ
ncbi:MAG: hypothetical protein JKY49_02050 [Cohaesibacteraceae bacterium]|nr:hypothetical protein [Cohaesibacteraceae bacterium]MBL4876262.1 hypothetical protein [Cohaesibacteraceae bacterium]